MSTNIPDLLFILSKSSFVLSFIHYIISFSEFFFPITATGSDLLLIHTTDQALLAKKGSFQLSLKRRLLKIHLLLLLKPRKRESAKLETYDNSIWSKETVRHHQSTERIVLQTF